MKKHHNDSNESLDFIPFDSQIEFNSRIKVFSSLHYIPVLASLIFTITCIAPFISSLLLGRHYSIKIPTISESAREFPGSKIFNVGSTIAGILVAFAGNILLDVPSLYGPSFPVYTKILPSMIAFFFIFVSGFGLDDNVFIHLTCALVGFFAMLVFSIFIYMVFSQIRIIKWKWLKLISLICGSISLISLAITWPRGNLDPIGSIKSLSEFIFVFAFSLFVLSWYKDLENYEIIIRFSR
ncbi:hypothetical protein TRFO_12983 [Tritrichomonas foetus]|uniref:CWH43-like N-terminal domain-containing protein n=1 Tax=Tritrichomonas foetus TaxID=1144522 RepID=A0A1J4L422_9EUKA|nr:hypothetical protein TRFO_12983 [Tritrichomonas foetus]|eukprot:OHT16724.1 hypothetical protein TRFO_12983 [Tritrichomonas foetus]